MKHNLINWEYDSEGNVKQFTVGIIRRHMEDHVVEKETFYKFQNRNLELSDVDNPEEYVGEHVALQGIAGVIPHEEGYEILKIAHIGRDYPVWWSIKVPEFEKEYEENVTDLVIQR